MNNNEYGVDNPIPIPIPIPIHEKPHRKVLTGLKLLTESYKFIHSTHKQQDHVSTHQTQLPHDLILHHILAKMPIKSLLQSKLVSKQWYYTLSSNEFANLHLKTCFSSYHPMNSHVECLFIQVEKRFYLFHIQEENVMIHYSLVKLEPNFGCTPQNELYLVGSCNGLVCLSDSVDGCFYLWNPVIYHWMRFSDLFLGSGYECRSSWGFGYVLSVNEYKVVKIEQKYDTNEVIVLLFSLQTKEWRRVFDHGLEEGVSLTKTSPGVLVNDTLFWVVDHPIKRHIVVGFDLVLEKFEEISGLTPRSREGYRDRFLCVMGGCLALYSSNLYKKGCVSILKKPGYVESVSVCSNSDSWSCTSLVGFTRTGKSLVVSKNWELGVVDLDSSPREYLTLLTFDKTRNSTPCILSYCPSLISLM